MPPLGRLGGGAGWCDLNKICARAAPGGGGPAAIDADGSVVRVEFHVNGSAVAARTVAPFTMLWAPDTIGRFTMMAVAVDNEGAATASTEVAVEVVYPGDIVLWITTLS